MAHGEDAHGMPDEQPVTPPTELAIARRRRLDAYQGRRERHVRIGDVAASNDPDEALVAIGLGSCVGICIADRQSGAIAVAHVFLPDSEGRVMTGTARGRYADTAVVALLELLGEFGASRASRLSAVVIGGAKMFTLATGGMDVGQRNIEAVRECLRQHGVRIAEELTGGTRGRTMRGYPGDCAVTAQAVSEDEHIVWPQPLKAAA